MAGASIRVNAKAAREALRRFGKTAADTPTLLKLVGLRHLRWVDKNFREEGTEQRWPPLSPNTVAGRRAGSSKPLQDTGRLRQSFDMRLLGRDAVLVGSNQEIARIHHEGSGPYVIRPTKARVLRFMTSAGPRFARRVHHPGIPQRRLLPRAKTAQDMAASVVRGAYRKAIRGT